MPWKMYKVNNYLRLESQSSNGLFTAPTKEICVQEKAQGSEEFRVFWRGKQIYSAIHYTDFVKENGQPFTLNQFLNFIHQNTGN